MQLGSRAIADQVHPGNTGIDSLPRPVAGGWRDVVLDRPLFGTRAVVDDNGRHHPGARSAIGVQIGVLGGLPHLIGGSFDDPLLSRIVVGAVEGRDGIDRHAEFRILGDKVDEVRELECVPRWCG